jgi:hypothetical protein
LLADNLIFFGQSFKKEHDAFVACQAASGFGWDEA